MKIQIVSLTKGSEKSLEPLEEDYRKRLLRSCQVQFTQIKRQDLGRGKKGQDTDWKRLRERIGKDTLILLDERGPQHTSVQLSKQWDQWMLLGKNLSFVIGGPEGFSDEERSSADYLISLSKLTLPHKLVRLFLIEALYRADDISRGGPYHNE